MSTRKTPFGVIRFGGSCTDDYDNIEIWHQTPDRTIKLQRPALRCFREAERRLTGRRRRAQHIFCTGTWRSCSYQRELYASDSNRYAHPDVTLHPRGLAIDVDQNQSWLKRRRIHRILTKLGWKRVRPKDEPWHYSYILEA